MFSEKEILLPARHEELMQLTAASGFSMCADLYTGSLIRTLVSSRPAGRFLELGTGTGLSLSFLADGMDETSTAKSIDNSDEFQQIAASHFKNDKRIEIICCDAGEWLQHYKGIEFDLIFADTWAGKFNLREEAIALLKPGGLYIIDDLLPQPNWPEGHEEKVKNLISELYSDKTISLTMMHWSTGICIASKK